jgi:hypothetical protein
MSQNTHVKLLWLVGFQPSLPLAPKITPASTNEELQRLLQRRLLSRVP